MSEFLRIRVPDGWNAILDEQAKRIGITKSRLVRRVLVDYTPVEMPAEKNTHVLKVPYYANLTWSK